MKETNQKDLVKSHNKINFEKKYPEPSEEINSEIDKYILLKKNSSYSPIQAKLNRELPFKESQCRLTHLMSHTGDSAKFIKLEDLMPKNLIRKIFWIGYFLDYAWFMSKLNPSCQAILVQCHHKYENEDCELSDGPNRKVIWPKLISAYNRINIKALLLVFDSYIRFVVGNINLIEADWTKTEKVLFLQDFPKSSITQFNSSNQLADHLYMIFESLGIKESYYSFLMDYDYSNFNGNLIWSIPNSPQPKDNALSLLKKYLTRYYKEKQLRENEIIIVTYLSPFIRKLNQNYYDHWEDLIYKDTGIRFKLKLMIPPKELPLNACQNNTKKFRKDDTQNIFNSPIISQYLHIFQSNNDCYLSNFQMILFSRSMDQNNEPELIYVGTHDFDPISWGLANPNGSTPRSFNLGVLITHNLTQFTLPFKFPPDPCIFKKRTIDSPAEQDFHYNDNLYSNKNKLTFRPNDAKRSINYQPDYHPHLDRKLYSDKKWLTSHSCDIKRTTGYQSIRNTNDQGAASVINKRMKKNY